MTTKAAFVHGNSRVTIWDTGTRFSVTPSSRRSSSTAKPTNRQSVQTWTDSTIEYAYRDSCSPTLHSVSAIHCIRLWRDMRPFVHPRLGNRCAFARPRPSLPARFRVEHLAGSAGNRPFAAAQHNFEVVKPWRCRHEPEHAIARPQGIDARGVEADVAAARERGCRAWTLDVALALQQTELVACPS